MVNEDYGLDGTLAVALETAEKNTANRNAPRVQSSRPLQTAPQATSESRPKVQQPTPQALPSRSGPASVLVSTRQKGNPVLNSIRSVPWEYSDIPADFVLGATTCALFLSLKYHRLHPEYIYSRIRALAGKYNLRILLTMVDIQNHEESLKELSKTSLINNVTIILCWSAHEAGRYLELYKIYEHAAPTNIKAHQSTNYSDKLIDFITIPRSINKTDAVGLVSNFGSLRTAINARPEEVSLIAGWGEKKVQRWCSSVREPFRIKRTARKGLGHEDSHVNLKADNEIEKHTTNPRVAARLGIGMVDDVHNENLNMENKAMDHTAEIQTQPELMRQPDADEEEALMEALVREKRPSQATGTSSISTNKRARSEEDNMSEGVLAALAKLRKL